ncbi:MAG: dipeptide ABC transporter ATP-binding protein [Deltaproteobacteria bacterium]|nr:dipeptide ABC transporter ATP-binding protein [Deltaproteobacteria bacterium]
MSGVGVPVLRIENLTIGYETEMGLLKAVRGISIDIQPRESFGLVGESGSGKTTLALGAIGYLAGNGRILEGRVFLKDQELTALPKKEMYRIWGRRVGMVYQNPGSALNPSMTIGRQLAETAKAHQAISSKQANDMALMMLAKVEMPNPESVARQYPHQLSGGMLQRCVIAMGLINNPELLIMDEPTTALDVTTQAVVLDLVSELKRKVKSAIFYITHDLAVVAKICDRIGVIYAGELMEMGLTRILFKSPLHPYTRSLLGCVPRFETKIRKQSLVSIPGLIPRLDELPHGCVFAPRCGFVRDMCRQARPPLMEADPGHYTACLRWRLLPAKFEPLREERKQDHPGMTPVLLETRKIKKHFTALEGLFHFGSRGKKMVKAVDGVSLKVRRGFTLGIVGESGCGKTTLVRTIIGLLKPTSGQTLLHTETLEPSAAERPRAILKKIQMVFQHPEASLNPRRTVAQAIQRPMMLFSGMDRNKLITRTYELLEAVNLPASYYNRFPGELSGGEKQRVAIARAFAADPELILLDEPLSALDVSVQASLINLLFDLQDKSNITYLFISHDLATVYHFSDWIAVMYLGRVVELGNADAVFSPPYHPYTEALLSAVPVADPDAQQQRIRLQGSVPSAIDVPSGCPFHTRCPRKVGNICEYKTPPYRETKGQSRIRCHIPPETLAELQSKAIMHTEDTG